jgi:fibronectin type 3 domain-containing protein
MKRVTVAALLLLLSALSVSAATIVIVNKDAAGVGFNDPTPAAPVGGNMGVTRGQQRLNAFQHAANIWGAKLSSTIPIKIAARFSPLTPCSESSGVIGSAGATTFLRNFPNAPRADTWYPVAQASAIAGVDFAVQFGIADGAHINASFNSAVGTAACLTGTFFYLGLDANEGDGIDLVATLLHEFGHGLGFSGITSQTTGAFATGGGTGSPDIFGVFTRDNTLGMNWHVMTNAQRLASVTNNENVVFDGPNATGAATTVLTGPGKDPSQHPVLFTPNPRQPGSSVYHFNTNATPNQLMEPFINDDLTHNVDVPNDLTTKVFADLGWPMPAPAVVPPASVGALATSATSVTISWTPSAAATSYRVYRTAHNANTYAMIASGITLTTFNDTSVLGGRAYLYKVRAFDGTSESADSNSDLATTVIFTDPTLTVGSTTVKSAHFTELRTAADAVRTLAGLVGFTYVDPTLSSAVSVKATHVTEIGVALSAARTILSLTSPSLPGATVAGTPIQAANITALRAAVQ